MTNATIKGGKAHLYWEAILARKWLVILATILVVAVCGYGTRFLTFDPDSRLFFGETSPERLALEELENTYAKENNVLIILAPKDGTLFTGETLAVIQEVTEKAWQTPYSSGVFSLTNYQHSFAQGDDVIVEDLVENAAELSKTEIESIRNIALTSPDLTNLLVSAAGDVTAVEVVITQPQEDLEEVPEIAAFVRTLADEIRRAHPEIDVYLSGGIMADITFAEAGERDIKTLIPIMIALICVTLSIGLHSVTATIATVFVILFSVVTALGIAGWAGLVLNGASSSTPIIIMGLAVADCVHVLMTVRQKRRDGLDQHGAIVESLRVNAAPIAVTSLTTAIGFTTLNFADSPPLRELGNIVAVGMVAAFVYSVTFLPALLAVLPATGNKGFYDGVAAMRRLAEFVVARPRPLLICGMLTVVAFVSGVPRLTFDDDFIRYFDASFPFRYDTDFMQDRLTGLHVLHYSLPAGEDQGVSRPDYLAKLDAFAEWFRGQDKVVHVTALSDSIKRLNKNMHGDDAAYYTIPENRELAAQYLLFYEMSLPYGHDLSSRIDVARSASRVSVQLVGVSSADIRELGARGEAWLAANAPALAAPATGLSMVYAYVSERNVRSMLGGTFLALVLISFSLILMLRSVRIGLMSLAPNLVPAAMAFGLWGYLYGEVNLAISVVGAMTLGIVVDDTVHFLSRYLRARRELGFDSRAAVSHAMETVGTALVLTSVALVLGFGVLATSGFAVSSQMGLLSAITIVIALIADLLFLPALLLVLARKVT